MDFSKSGAGAEGSVGAFEAVWWTAVEAGCSMADAREAVEEIMPELYGDHWDDEWQKRQDEWQKRKAETEEA